MSSFNWVDFILIFFLLVGMAVGYSQGFVRQLIGLAALYIALVIATQFFQPLSRAFGDLLKSPPNTLSNALSFFALFFIVLALVNYLGIDAYRSTHIQLLPAIDHIAGLLLGVASMWILLAIAVNVLAFAVNTQVWGGDGELYRIIIQVGLGGSRIAQVTATTLPMIVSTVRPWLPGGLPAIFDL